MKNCKLYFAVGLMLCLSAQIYAQPGCRHPRPTVEEMLAGKWRYIVEKAQLTPEEQQKVEPVYREYEQSSWKLQKDYFSERRKQDISNFTEDDFRAANAALVRKDEKEARLLADYRKKLEHLLSPKKLFFYYDAERKFRRDLMRGMPK